MSFSNEFINSIIKLQTILIQNGGNSLDIQVDKQVFVNLIEDLHYIYNEDKTEEAEFLIVNGPMCATKITVTDV
jgi:hypothetical protein